MGFLGGADDGRRAHDGVWPLRSGSIPDDPTRDDLSYNPNQQGLGGPR